MSARVSITKLGSPVVAFFLLTCALGGLWALATPIMAVPDEPAHVIKAASLVRGQLVGSSAVRTPTETYERARVPETLAYPTPPCLAFSRSPSCMQELRGRGDRLVEIRSHAAGYNPAYYATVALPTLVRPGQLTVYVMRFVTVVEVALLLTLAVLALRELSRPRWALAGLAAAATPMTFFLAGSVNPNAVEIAASVGLWATLLVWLSSPDPALDRSRAIRAAVCAIALVLTRSLAPFFLLLIVGGSLLVATRPRAFVRSPAVRRAALVVGLVTAAALAWTVTSGGPSGGGGVAEYPEFDNARRYLYSTTLLLARYEREMIGVFGWLDTPAQAHVYVAWFAVLGFLVLAALAVGRRQVRLLLVGLVAFSAVFPLVVQWPVATQLGLIWQGRYLLPVMVGLPLAAGVILAESRPWNELVRGNAGFWAVVGTLAAAHAAAYWWALHRWVIGLSEDWIGFEPLWQPPLGWVALTLAFAVAIAAWAVTLTRLARPAAVSRSDSGSAF